MTARDHVDRLDGYLMRVLCALVDERSVSRAANRLEQTQPAVSAALKRLREVFNDPLLVRDKLEMVPTARARVLAERARTALDAMDRLLAPDAGFDPANSTETFRVASPDYLAPEILAEVAQQLRSQAPGARLELHPMGPDFDGERALADDTLDVVIGNWPSPPERLHLALLMEDELVCLVRAGHPLVRAGSGRMSEASYLAAQHIAPMRYSSVQRGVVETHLAGHRTERQTPVLVPYFGLAPHIVARTDLVFTTAKHFANTFVGRLPVVALAAPDGFPRMRFYQLWHERAHHAPAHRWLRGLVSTVARSYAAAP